MLCQQDVGTTPWGQQLTGYHFPHWPRPCPSSGAMTSDDTGGQIGDFVCLGRQTSEYLAHWPQTDTVSDVYPRHRHNLRQSNLFLITIKTVMERKSLLTPEHGEPLGRTRSWVRSQDTHQRPRHTRDLVERCWCWIATALDDNCDGRKSKEQGQVRPLEG